MLGAAKVDSIIELPRLARLLGLPNPEETMDKLNDSNGEYAYENGKTAHDEAIRAGKSEEQAEAARERAEQWVYDKISECVRLAIIEVAEHIFEQHGLTLVHSKKYPGWRFKVEPTYSWDDALIKIRNTIQGVGMFDIGRDNREFCHFGPWTLRQAVLVHLGHMKDRAEVYGERRPMAIYDDSITSCFGRHF